MNDLTHIDEHGAARMVDVSGKGETRREARAQAVLHAAPATIEAIRAHGIAKGDVLAVARVAGILAAKRVSELIPLCHTLPLSAVTVDFELGDDSVTIVASAITVAATGVEMEALTAASIAALTIYDMVKAIDKRLIVGDIHLLSKTGGRSGDFQWS